MFRIQVEKRKKTWKLPPPRNETEGKQKKNLLNFSISFRHTGAYAQRRGASERRNENERCVWKLTREKEFSFIKHKRQQEKSCEHLSYVPE